MNHSKYLLILFISLVFFSSITFTQTINTEHITTTEGLSGNRINTIFQDSYGFLWFGTDNGLDRYDGYEFKVYKHVAGDKKSIGSNRIESITEDKNHNLWIAQWNGISRYDRYTKTFKNYNLNKISNHFVSIAPKAIKIYCDSRNEIWARLVTGENFGPVKYDKQTDQFIPVRIDTEKAGSNKQIYNLSLSICEFKGNVWTFNSRGDLCFFNRKKNLFEPQKFFSDDKSFLSKNRVNLFTSLYPDKNGFLWVVTGTGIYKFNPVNDSLSTITLFKKRPYNISQSGVTLDKNGNLLIGYSNEGLYKFNGISDRFKKINYTGISSNSKIESIISGITSLYTDRSGITWIGTYENGLFKYDPTRETFINYKYNPENKNSISGNNVLSFYQSKLNKDLIYVSTLGAGFDKFYPSRHKFKRVNFNLKNSIIGTSVKSILENKDGSLYLGTEYYGLYKYYPDGNTKLIVKWDLPNIFGFSENNIRVIKRDSKGLIWIGTGLGLNILNPHTKKIKKMYSIADRHYPKKLMNLIRTKENTSVVIQSILRVGDNKNITKKFTINKTGKFLCVSAGEGSIIIRPNRSDYGWIENQRGDTVWTSRYAKDLYYLSGAIKNTVKIGLIKLTKGNYKLRYISDDAYSYGNWIDFKPPADSALWGIQVIKLNDKEILSVEKLLKEAHDQTLISGWDIEAIHFDKNGTVWIGTSRNGLTKYNPATGKIKYYKAASGNRNSISSNDITCICENTGGILWIGTGKGLDRFNPVKGKFTIYTKKDGLSSNNISSVLKDDYGHLWISTSNGISMMSINKSTGKVSFVNYNTKDGLSNSTFYGGSAIKGNDGKLYFGGTNGLNELIPNKLNFTPPIVRITGIKIWNKAVSKMGKDDPLKVPVMSAKKLTLSSSQNDISFEFAALHYSRPYKNKYSYMLQGYDKTWHNNNLRFATYTNLDPGNYDFKVKAANSDGVWNYKGTSLKIIILPPWWKTGWAYAGYIFLFAGLVFSTDRFQRKRLLDKERERQKIKEMELRAKAAEAESRALELENERKTKELEEARQLQLSMLPKEIPTLPNLDIAVYMKTATEVGGDYYDFNLHPDGTLTVLLGDATGHGMQSGMMVSIMKSLFMSDRTNKTLKKFFENAGAAIKDMNLGRLMMALNCIQIKNDKIMNANAGMPPLFIYRNQFQTVEEISFENMPLGALKGLYYDTKEVRINSGDVLLMMSDGFAELRNDNGELYGYSRAQNCFKEAANKGPEEVISNLRKEGSRWTNNSELEDDITFVVVKVK